MSSSSAPEASLESSRTDSPTKEKRRSTIFSVFSSSSRKSTGSRSSLTTDPSVASSATVNGFPHNTYGNTQSTGSQIPASQLQNPFLDASQGSNSSHDYSHPPTSLPRPRPSSPSRHSRHVAHRKIPTSPASPPSIAFPPMNTQAKVSPTTRPSQKFLSQMPLSLALKTATIATPLPVVKTGGPQDNAQPSKVRQFLFGSRDKPNPAGPKEYEFGGRSTYALVHGSILRYHSAFGDDLKNTATPDSAHFLNPSSIVCVTDAVQGFKWVLEIKTWSKSHGIKSPIKKSKSTKNLKDRSVDLTVAPWGVVDGVQAWYLIFETPNLMSEWMALVRAAVSEIKERESRGEKSPKTPKSVKTPIKSSGKTSKHSKSPRISSPPSSVSESLPSSPSSSRKSFLTNGLSNRNSLIENNSSEEKVGGNSSNLDAGVGMRQRSRQPSQQDIALTAFRISAYEEDLADFVPPVSIESTPDIRLPPDSGIEHHHPALTPNLSHYAHKRASIISLQSRLSSLSSGPRSPNTSIVSPTSSPTTNHSRRRRTLRRTYSGESSKTNGSWKHLQALPPPHPPPTGPLPVPPMHNYPYSGSASGDLFGKRDSLVYDKRESLILGISPVFEADTPKTLRDVTPRSSPCIESRSTMGNLNGVENIMYSVKVA
jgi:hypothetical protein